MASIRIGGDPENYMEAPQMTVTDKGGGVSIIASVLDLLGVGRQVAKEPKQEPAAESPTGTTQSIPPATKEPVNLPALEGAANVFQPVMNDDWGKRYLDSIKPIKTIDPNSAF